MWHNVFIKQYEMARQVVVLNKRKLLFLSESCHAVAIHKNYSSSVSLPRTKRSTVIDGRCVSELIVVHAMLASL